MEPFPPIPPIPPQIFDSIEKEKFMIFMGAGVSRLLGCLGWEDMCKQLVYSCRRENIIDDMLRDGLIDIIKNYNYKELLTRCYAILDKSKRLDIYENVIKLTCNGDIDKIRDYNAYDEILRMPAVYVTTNFDDILANKFLMDRIKYKEGDFKLDINRETLYQIHGSISDIDTIIVTENDYYKKYTNKEFIEFLKYVFNEYLILFVGYGLNEMEINLLIYENILKKNYNNFLLKPYHDKNIHMYYSDALYYTSKGVNILPYYIMNEKYELLLKVLRQWNYEIRNKTSKILEDMKAIDELIMHYG